MALMDEAVSEQTAVDEPNIPFGGPANPGAVTDTRWVTIRGDIAPYPFQR